MFLGRRDPDRRQMRPQRHSIRGLMVTAACVGTAAIGASSGIAADSGSITLYSGQHEQTVSKLVADFEQRGGAHVSVRSADEATLANQILQEGSRSPADVFFAENPPALQVLSERGLLAPVRAATLSAVAR